MSETLNEHEKLLEDLAKKINRMVEISEKRFAKQSLTIEMAAKTSTNIEKLRDRILKQQVELANQKGDIKIVTQLDNYDMTLANLQAKVNIESAKLSNSFFQYRVQNKAPENYSIQENYSVQSDIEETELEEKDPEVFNVLITPETKDDALEFYKAKTKSIILELEDEPKLDEKNAAETTDQTDEADGTQKIEQIEKVKEQQIKVLGHWQTLFSSKKRLIGYVPPHIAAKLINANSLNYFQPELIEIRFNDQKEIEIEIGIKGSKDRYVAAKA